MQTSIITGNLKKYFYSGVGLASHTGEIVQHSVNEFVKQGRVSEADGKKIVTSAIKKIEDRMPAFEARYNEAVSKALKFAHAEIAMLQKKIDALEKKGGSKTVKRELKTVAKKVVRKVATKTKARKVAAKSH